MALRIGCDLDGVLADMELALEQLAEKLFGARVKDPKKDGSGWSTLTAWMSDIVPEQATDDAPLLHEMKLTAKQRRVLWRAVRARDGFWESLEEIEPGAVARLGKIAIERRWEIIFLTRRSATAGATPQIQSQRWLEAKGFRLPSVFVVTGSRGSIASALGLDIVVDDAPQNLLDVAVDSKARAIGVFRNPETTLPPALQHAGVHLARSADECFNLLCEIDSSLQEPEPGAVDRVLRKLGLKQPAST
jgi:hypothetical protein